VPFDAPAWATANIPEQLLDGIAALQTARDPQAYHAAIRRLHELCADPAITAALAALSDLRPDLPLVETAVAVTTLARDIGLDSLLTDLDRRSERAALISRWLDAESWATSYRLLRDHPALTDDPAIIDELYHGFTGAHAHRHAVILRLAGHYPVQQIYDALLDPTDAADLLHDAILTAEPEAIQLLWQLTDHISRDPFLSPLAAAVVAVYTGNPTDARTLAATAGTAADQRARQTAARLMRNRADQDTDHADLLRSLADTVLTAPDDDAPG
jgi:hypothetical protein